MCQKNDYDCYLTKSLEFPLIQENRGKNGIKATFHLRLGFENLLNHF